MSNQSVKVTPTHEAEVVSSVASDLLPGLRRVANQVDRFRYLWFATIALFMVLSFNGKWRIEPDSANFRQLGHELATTGRYFIKENVPGLLEYHYKQGTIFPGFPIFLGWMERLFGPAEKSVLPVLVAVNLMAVVTLVILYRLLLFYIPRWQAVCAIVGIGTNAEFLSLSNGIISDIPFLLGLSIAFLGFEYIVRSKSISKLTASAIFMFAGLLVATTVRPTFYFIDGALGVACIWVFWKRRLGWRKESQANSKSTSEILDDPVVNDVDSSRLRRRAVLILGLLLVSFALFRFVLDIRDKRSTGIASGGYESRAVGNLKDFNHKILPRLAANIGEMFETCIPQAFLGYRTSVGLIPMGDHRLGLSTVYGLVLIFSGMWMGRRNVFWGAFVAITVGLLILSGPVARYILMLLPFFMVGWGRVVANVSARFSTAFRQAWAARLGFGYVLVSNILSSAILILIQRGYTSPMNEQHRWQKIQYVGFEKAYRDGYWIGFDDLAGLLKKHLKPTDKIFGPDAGVLTYMSERQVYGPTREVINELLKPGAKNETFIMSLFPTEARMKIARKAKPSPVEAPNYDQDFGKHVDAGRIIAGKHIAGPAYGYDLCEVVLNMTNENSKQLSDDPRN